MRGFNRCYIPNYRAIEESLRYQQHGGHRCYLPMLLTHIGRHGVLDAGWPTTLDRGAPGYGIVRMKPLELLLDGAVAGRYKGSAVFPPSLRSHVS